MRSASCVCKSELFAMCSIISERIANTTPDYRSVAHNTRRGSVPSNSSVLPRFDLMQKKGTPSHPSAAGLAQAGHRASSIIRKTLITMALGMFGAAGALAVVQPADGNLPIIQQARQILPL